VLIDFRELEDGIQIRADLCIVGGGPAGISLALALENSPLEVCVLESGGLGFGGAAQALNTGSNVGLPYFDLDACRLRYFGGTTGHWSGWCNELAPIDFQDRSWIGHSGWPISEEELAPHLGRAHELLELPPPSSNTVLWERLGQTPVDFDPEALRTSFWHFSPPTRFGQKYREALAASRTTDVYLNANAVNVQADPSGSRISHIDVATLSGGSGQVVARAYVLAAGAIENARILLCSDGVDPRGLGNGHELVGRFFMEHPHVHLGQVATDDHYRLLDSFARVGVHGTDYKVGFSLSPTVQTRHGTLNANATLMHTAGKREAPGRVVRDLLQAMGSGLPNRELGGRFWRMVREFDARLYEQYRSRVGATPWPAPSELSSLTLMGVLEQAPNPDSRVALAEEVDALGLRRVALDWRLSDLETHTAKVLTTTVAEEFGRLGLGRVRLAQWLLDDSPIPGLDNLGESTDPWGASFQVGSHHMGTTRMADDPTMGVVDRDCRVHGLDDLYIAGSSVFPTSGYANPTLTLVQLALRLAEHLRGRLT